MRHCDQQETVNQNGLILSDLTLVAEVRSPTSAQVFGFGGSVWSLLSVPSVTDWPPVRGGRVNKCRIAALYSLFLALTCAM